MHDFFHLLAALALSLAAVAYVPLANILLSGMLVRPHILAVGAVFREAVGPAIRRRQRLPALRCPADPFWQLGLNRGSATVAQVARCARQWSRLMELHPWAYPASQRQILWRHCDAAAASLTQREAFLRMAADYDRAREAARQPALP